MITEKTKVFSLVAANGVGTAAQHVIPTTSTVESYLRIVLLVVQIVIGVATVIYVYRRLKKKP